MTYINTSAAAHTWPILNALGYRRYSQGQFAARAGAEAGQGPACDALADADRDLPDYDLLAAHAAAGCLALVCETPEGPEPFVFLRRRISGLPFGAMQLVYARDTARFVACAGPLGRWLLRARRAAGALRRRQRRSPASRAYGSRTAVRATTRAPSGRG